MPTYKMLKIPAPAEYSSIADLRSFETPAIDMTEAESSLNALAEQGWRIISMQPLIRAEYGISQPQYEGAIVSFSLTDSLVVLLEKV